MGNKHPTPLFVPSYPSDDEDLNPEDFDGTNHQIQSLHNSGMKYKTALEAYVLKLDIPMNNYDKMRPAIKDLHGDNPAKMHRLLKHSAEHFQNQFQFTVHFKYKTTAGEIKSHLRVLQCTRFLGSGGVKHVFQCHEIGLNGEQGQVYAVGFFHTPDKEIAALKLRASKSGWKTVEGLTPHHENVITVHAWTTNDSDPVTKKPYMDPDLTTMSASGVVVLNMGHFGEICTHYLMKLRNNDGMLEVPQPILRRIMRDVFQGVDFLRNHGVAHRDIKSENLI